MTAPITVLLIEDNSGDARLVKEELRSVNSHTTIRLEWANCLAKGLECLAASHFNAVLLDLNLPDSEGLGTLHSVLSFTPNTPVIVMTGQADDEMGLGALQAGAQDYLIKGQLDGRLLMRVIQYAIQRKQTEMQLADALEFTKHLLTSSPIGIFTYKLSGECLSANPAAAQMVGATVEQLERQNFRELESWKRSGLFDLAERAIASKQLTASDVHVITTFGKESWYRAQFVTFKSGGEELLLMIFNDITERKYTEAALEASEKRFRAWIENSSDIVTVLDSSGVIQHESSSVTRLLGYAPEDLLGKNAFDFVHPEDQEKIINLFLENIQGPDTTTAAEFRFRHQDGSWKSLEAAGRTYIDEHDEVVALINSRDITDRQRAEQALKEKERLLSEAQRIGHIGSWSYDIPADRITFSDEMYRLLDILPTEFNHTSKGLLNLIYASDRSLTAKWLEDTKVGMQSKELNFRIFRKNSELRYLQWTGAVNFDNNGRPIRFIGTMQDVTERRAAEMQIEQQIKRLTALSEIDHAIMSSFDQRYTLGVILSQVISQLQVDAADVLILESDSQMLKYAAGQGFRAKQREMAPLRLGEGHAGRAAKERRMIRIPDLRETVNEPLFDTIVSTEGFVGYIGAPLIVKGKVKGVLEVYQRSFLQPYPEWLEFFNTLVGQAVIAIENAELFGNLQTSNEELSQAYDATIEGWSRAMDLRDRETEGHTQRVTNLTLELARAMGMDESRLVHIRRGALLHDMGKIGVPDHILFRPDTLTPGEMEIMQKHPEFAYEMLSPIAYLKPALAIPYCHHEKWDGTGYPLGLKGLQIPLEARIFAVADVWDALTSDRPYRKAWSEEEAFAYIREQSGRHFDPQVVDLFFKVIK
ncbi:MAG: PAS domain S-box protein [Anaerolineales bacterium]